METNNQQEAVQSLIDGKVDAFIGNRITGQYFLQKNEQQSLIKIVGEPLDTTNYAVAVMPKNKELLTLFNQAISQIKKDGTYEKIEKKWFGNISCQILNGYAKRCCIWKLVLFLPSL